MLSQGCDEDYCMAGMTSYLQFWFIAKRWTCQPRKYTMLSYHTTIILNTEDMSCKRLFIWSMQQQTFSSTFITNLFSFLWNTVVCTKLIMLEIIGALKCKFSLFPSPFFFVKILERIKTLIEQKIFPICIRSCCIRLCHKFYLVSYFDCFLT